MPALTRSGGANGILADAVVGIGAVGGHSERVGTPGRSLQGVGGQPHRHAQRGVGWV